MINKILNIFDLNYIKKQKIVKLNFAKFHKFYEFNINKK